MVPLVLGLLGDLTAGASMAGSGSCDSGTGDLLCSDDLTQWRSFANSFQMRLTMRLSEVDPATAQAEFAAAYATVGFTGNADNALLDYPDPPCQNRLCENYLTCDDNGVSATMIDVLT